MVVLLNYAFVNLSYILIVSYYPKLILFQKLKLILIEFFIIITLFLQNILKA